MEKLKENKIWITVIVFGIIIVGILLLMLKQQKESTPAGQESSYSASVKASSSSQLTQDQKNVKSYARKASKMKGSVIVIGDNAYFTDWHKSDFVQWANSYNALTDAQKHNASSNFGTSKTIANDSIDVNPLSKRADSIVSNDYVNSIYFETIKAYNKAYPAVNPDDIIK